MESDTEFWTSHVDACRRSGVVAASVYARQHGLTLASLYYPLTTRPSQRPRTGIGSWRRRINVSRTAASVARIRFLIVSLTILKPPLSERLSAAVIDKRHPAYVIHPQHHLIKQRIYQIACGYEDGNDCNTLRQDPVFQLALETSPSAPMKPRACLHPGRRFRASNTRPRHLSL